MNKAEKETLLCRTAPSRQKQAQEYLQGRSPGTMQRYAPTPTPTRNRAGWRTRTPCAALQNGERKRSTDAGRARPAPYMQPAGAYASAVRLLFALRVKRSLSTI